MSRRQVLVTPSPRGLALVVSLALGLAACGNAETPRAAEKPTATRTAAAPSTPPAPSPTSTPSTGPVPTGADGVPEGMSPFYSQRLRWTACDGGFQCAKLDVPVDHDAPGGRRIQLALIRLPASDKAGRLGSLVVNPGGPGASGVEYARGGAGVVSETVLRRYDLVGFDPRGVGASAPLDCLSDKQVDTFLAADPTPDTPAEVTRSVALGKQLGAGCVADDPELAARVGTRDAARDLDVLRAALGDDKLTYVGRSYGTALGTSYAEQFPTRVGRMVLDGAMDPSLSAEQVNLGQAKGFEQAARAFVEDCQSYGECPLGGGGVESGLRALQALLAKVDAKPLRTSEKARPATEGLASLGVALALYDEGYWPILKIALATAKAGNGDQLLGLADVLTQRGADGRFNGNGNTVIYAVNCVDRPQPGGVERVRAQAVEFARQAPLFGPFLAWSALPCATWPVPATDGPRRVTAEGSGPIVVIGTTRDPATPYAWAQGLAGQLADGRLVTYDGDGHTAYRRGSDCVDRAVDRWLLSGEAPRDGTRCD